MTSDGLNCIISYSFSLNQTSNTTHYRFVSCHCHQCHTGISQIVMVNIAGAEYKQIFKKPPPKQTQQPKNEPQPRRPLLPRSVPSQQRKPRQKAIKRGTKRKHKSSTKHTTTHTRETHFSTS